MTRSFRGAPRVRRVHVAALVVLAAASLGFTAAAVDYAWEETPTGTSARLRGVAAVSNHVAWTSGSLRTVLRTVDSGQTWQSLFPEGKVALQFRDIEAWDRDRAVILSIGPGRNSRIYVTEDGGATWELGFRNTDPSAFYDCMTFFDQKHGLALSDPVDGRFRIIRTEDGGHSWDVVDTDMPPALEGEFAFAASGQCLVDAGDGHAWFATGGGAVTRVFRTSDGGRTWEVSETPIPSGPSAGIFALAFRDALHGIAVGGDFADPTNAPDSIAVTDDGGVTWELATTAPNEYRSGVAWINDEHAVAVGPTGSDVTFDGGRTWQPLDEGSYDTVDCTARGDCWASGEQGRAARLRSRG